MRLCSSSNSVCFAAGTESQLRPLTTPNQSVQLAHRKGAIRRAFIKPVASPPPYTALSFSEVHKSYRPPPPHAPQNAKHSTRSHRRLSHCCLHLGRYTPHNIAHYVLHRSRDTRPTTPLRCDYTATLTSTTLASRTCDVVKNKAGTGNVTLTLRHYPTAG